MEQTDAWYFDIYSFISLYVASLYRKMTPIFLSISSRKN